MLLCNLAHDRESQTAAVDVGAEDAIEAVEDALPLAFRNARPVVLDFQVRECCRVVRRAR